MIDTTAPVSPPRPKDDQPLAETISPTVIIPRNNGSVPRWFYFIFGITIIIFFLVTTLLVMQLTQKQQSANMAVPTIIPKVTQSVVISPVLSPAATDAAILQLNTMESSDEITSIEADLQNTDLTVLDKGLEAIDIQMNNSTP